MSTFKIAIFILLTLLTTDSLMVHHTTYQISSIQIPNISHLKQSKSCKYTQPKLKSISFPKFNQFNILTTLQHIDPHSIVKCNYTQYNLLHSMNILPTELHNIITHIKINLNTTHNSLCVPNFIILPITNNHIKLKCLIQNWNSMTNTMTYKCNPSTIIPFTPSTTIFYSIDNDYKSNLHLYNEQKRRLFNSNKSNKTYVPAPQHTNSNKTKINPLYLWIIISASIIFILLTFGIYCICHRRNKKNMKTNTNHSENETLQHKNCINKYKPNTVRSNSNKLKTDEKSNNDKNNTKYKIIPNDNNTMENNNIFKRERIIEMAHFVHGTVPHIINQTDSSSDSPSNNTLTLTNLNSSNKKRNPLSICDDTDPPMRPRTPRNKLRDRQRLYTDSFDTAQSESIYSLTNENEYVIANENNISPILTAQLPSHWMQSKYMRVLPDDEEQETKTNVFNNNTMHRRSQSLEVRRDSEDIDHNKLDTNSWGTSLPLHETGLIEGKNELSKHTFFYHAPKIKKKKKKKGKFKHRIKEDANLNKELEDDIINQMVTDSEMSHTTNESVLI